MLSIYKDFSNQEPQLDCRAYLYPSPSFIRQECPQKLEVIACYLDLNSSRRAVRGTIVRCQKTLAHLKRVLNTCVDDQPLAKVTAKPLVSWETYKRPDLSQNVKLQSEVMCPSGTEHV